MTHSWRQHASICWKFLRGPGTASLTHLLVSVPASDGPSPPPRPKLPYLLPVVPTKLSLISSPNNTRPQHTVAQPLSTLFETHPVLLRPADGHPTMHRTGGASENFISAEFALTSPSALHRTTTYQMENLSFTVPYIQLALLVGLL